MANDIISIGKIHGSFRRTFRRFPVTVVLLIAWVIWEVLTAHKLFSEATTVSVGYFLRMLGFFSLTIKLWSEAFWLRKKITRWLLTGALVIVAADAVWIYCHFFEVNSDVYFIARFFIIMALMVGTVSVPVRSGEKEQWWFSARQIVNLLWAMGLFVIIFFALIIILFAIGTLFNCDSFQWLDPLRSVFVSGLPALIFLSNIPATDEKQVRPLSEFFNGLVKYILLPLTLVYMAILYIYGGKILLLWDLPRGGVAWPVMWLVCCVVLFLYAIRPFMALETSTLWRKTIRRLPMAMLPLLVLLAVAIGYRVGQYGVTADRLYVVTFTLWSFAAMLYCGLSRSCRIVPVIRSLAVFFVATAVISGAYL